MSAIDDLLSVRLWSLLVQEPLYHQLPWRGLVESYSTINITNCYVLL